MKKTGRHTPVAVRKPLAGAGIQNLSDVGSTAAHNQPRSRPDQQALTRRKGGADAECRASRGKTGHSLPTTGGTRSFMAWPELLSK